MEQPDVAKFGLGRRGNLVLRFSVAQPYTLHDGLQGSRSNAALTDAYAQQRNLAAGAMLKPVCVGQILKPSVNRMIVSDPADVPSQ
jgi:hypothetical protein